MNAITLRPNGVGLLLDEDKAAAGEAARALSQPGATAEVRVQAGENDQAFILPAPAARLLAEMLGLMAQGRSVIMMHDSAELTTQQAADLLHVSRPYLIKLLDEGALPCRMVGTHRRVHLSHVLAFKRAQDIKARAALRELVQQAQELDMGY